MWSACVRFAFSKAHSGCCVGNTGRPEHNGGETSGGERSFGLGPGGDGGGGEKERDFSYILEEKLTGFERVLQEQRNLGYRPGS